MIQTSKVRTKLSKTKRVYALSPTCPLSSLVSCYTRRCVWHERCVCASLLSVSDPPEARKVSFLARPNMSSLMRPICMVDDECKVQIDEAASCGRCYTRRCV